MFPGFFKAHPNNGSFVHWPVYGGRAPEDFPHALRQKMAQELPHWQRDKLVERVAQLKAWLETPQDVPTVYFFHCEQCVPLSPLPHVRRTPHERRTRRCELS